ncbi:hypothetical protein, partial [Rhodoblastus sp.]|uniref:hypothetical protein n=1 Tax=Rhodoblastus sp. TaxID=1962975 RepID=UPI003FD8772F
FLRIHPGKINESKILKEQTLLSIGSLALPQAKVFSLAFELERERGLYDWSRFAMVQRIQRLRNT